MTSKKKKTQAPESRSPLEAWDLQREITNKKKRGEEILQMAGPNGNKHKAIGNKNASLPSKKKSVPGGKTSC